MPYTRLHGVTSQKIVLFFKYGIGNFISNRTAAHFSGLLDSENFVIFVTLFHI
jgi:hypothetical protein